MVNELYMLCLFTLEPSIMDVFMIDIDASSMALVRQTILAILGVHVYM